MLGIPPSERARAIERRLTEAARDVDNLLWTTEERSEDLEEGLSWVRIFGQTTGTTIPGVAQQPCC